MPTIYSTEDIARFREAYADASPTSECGLSLRENLPSLNSAALTELADGRIGLVSRIASRILRDRGITVAPDRIPKS